MIEINIDELMKDAKAEEAVKAQPAEIESNTNAAAQHESEGNHQAESQVMGKENKDNDVVNEEPVVEAKSDEGENQNNVDTNISSESKSKYTQQEKINHSFSKLKAKNKAKIEKLESENERLRKELESYRNKTVEDFKSQEEYLDARQDARWNIKEIERRQAEIDELKQEEIAATNRNRFNTLYSTDEEKKNYAEAWEIGKQNGVLEAIASDKDIMNFINDSEYGPKLIEHFIRRPSVLQGFMNMNTGRKNFELYSMEKRLAKFLNDQATKVNQVKEPDNKSLVENKNSNSIIGKQVTKSDTIKSTDDFASDDDVFAFIRNH